MKISKFTIVTRSSIDKPENEFSVTGKPSEKGEHHIACVCVSKILSIPRSSPVSFDLEKCTSNGYNT